VPADSYTVPLGKADIAREGNDVTLIAWGAMVRVCLDASEVLAREDVSAEVVDLRTLNPLDRETMIESVVKTGRAVVVHEAVRTGGFGAEIAAQIGEHALLQLEAPVQRVAGFDVVFPLAQNERLYLPSRERIVRAAEKALAF
jgi:pyruvate dehydrogenase E1 component beta subunit